MQAWLARQAQPQPPPQQQQQQPQQVQQHEQAQTQPSQSSQAQPSVPGGDAANSASGGDASTASAAEPAPSPASAAPETDVDMKDAAATSTVAPAQPSSSPSQPLPAAAAAASAATPLPRPPRLVGFDAWAQPVLSDGAVVRFAPPASSSEEPELLLPQPTATATSPRDDGAPATMAVSTDPAAQAAGAARAHQLLAERFAAAAALHDGLRDKAAAAEAVAAPVSYGAAARRAALRQAAGGGGSGFNVKRATPAEFALEAARLLGGGGGGSSGQGQWGGNALTALQRSIPGTPPQQQQQLGSGWEARGPGFAASTSSVYVRTVSLPLPDPAEEAAIRRLQAAQQQQQQQGLAPQHVNYQVRDVVLVLGVQIHTPAVSAGACWAAAGEFHQGLAGRAPCQAAR